MPHTEIYLLRSIPLVRLLILPNLFHLIFDVLLDLQVAFLLLHIRLVLVLPLNLFGLLNAKQSTHLRLVTLENGCDRLLLLLLDLKLFDLVVVLKPKAVSH